MLSSPIDQLDVKVEDISDYNGFVRKLQIVERLTAKQAL